MHVMSVSSLRRTAFILLSVMGLFLVLSCFISTEDYFMKQARIVQNAHDGTTHDSITAARTTRQSLHRATERRGDRDGDRGNCDRSTTNSAGTTKVHVSSPTARKSTETLPTGITDRGIKTFGNTNKTEVDNQPLVGRVIRNRINTRIVKGTHYEALETKDVQNFIDNKNKPNLFSSHQLEENVSMETLENEGDAVIMKPMEPVHKNTFLSVKYKNTERIQDFKHRIDGQKGVPVGGEYENEKEVEDKADVFSLIKRRNSKDSGGKEHRSNRKYFDLISKGKMRLVRGHTEINKSVLRQVQWQPHYDSHNYSYLMTPDTNCLDLNGEYINVTLVVFILTSPIHYSNRRVIRHTWKSQAQSERLDMRIIFLLGATDDIVVQHYIKDEAEQHRDILQEDFHDSYVNLTLKTIMGLKWSTLSCPKAKFVMKVDDDVAVNVVDLMAYLKTLDPDEDFIGGLVTKGAVPYRNPNKKWYVSEEIYPYPTYPPYPQGKSYIMTMNVTRELFETSKQLEIFPWEDVFIGLCLEKINLLPSQIQGFDYFQPALGSRREIWKNDESFKILQGLLIVFDLNEAQMETIWHVWRYKEWPNVYNTKQRRT